MKLFFQKKVRILASLSFRGVHNGVRMDLVNVLTQSRFSTILAFGIFLVLVVSQVSKNLPSPERFWFSVHERDVRKLLGNKLKFITLSFNISDDVDVIDHNCALLFKHGYRFEIHTDDLLQPYCQTCTCIPFRAEDCKCHFPSKDNCNHCHKLIFLVDKMKNEAEFVFIDSDLVILNDTFMPLLHLRTIGFDFLAAYGFVTHKEWSYRSQFNSGLMYIRRVSGVNYDDMFRLKEKIQTNSDQVVLSQFIHQQYVSWDVLSLRWHCRYLERTEHSINIQDCFTFHAHSDVRRQFLRDFNWSKSFN